MGGGAGISARGGGIGSVPIRGAGTAVGKVGGGGGASGTFALMLPGRLLWVQRESSQHAQKANAISQAKF